MRVRKALKPRPSRKHQSGDARCRKYRQFGAVNQLNLPFARVRAGPQLFADLHPAMSMILAAIYPTDRRQGIFMLGKMYRKTFFGFRPGLLLLMDHRQLVHESWLCPR